MDRYDEKAKQVCNLKFGYELGLYETAVAQFGRECAAEAYRQGQIEAYEDALIIVKDTQRFFPKGNEHPYPTTQSDFDNIVDGIEDKAATIRKYAEENQ